MHLELTKEEAHVVLAALDRYELELPELCGREVGRILAYPNDRPKLDSAKGYVDKFDVCFSRIKTVRDRIDTALTLEPLGN